VGLIKEFMEFLKEYNVVALVKAAPMMKATASATTLYSLRNSINSLIRPTLSPNLILISG
jgi:large-conductance mechanosensitive channel